MAGADRGAVARLPHRVRAWQTVYGLFRHWQRQGVWAVVLSQLQARADAAGLITGESVQALVAENTTLKRRVQQLTAEHRLPQEHLEGARSNLRFADKRIADLEAQLLEPQPPGPDTTGRP